MFEATTIAQSRKKNGAMYLKKGKFEHKLQKRINNLPWFNNG